MLVQHSRLAQAKRKVTDWRHALDTALTPLYEAGYTRMEYYQGVVDNTLEWGPYYLVAPGVALPHARPEQGALANGIAVTTLEEPVCFGHDECDPVWLLFALCATDANAHLETIQRISTLLGDQALLAQLRDAHTDGQLLELLNARGHGEK